MIIFLIIKISYFTNRFYYSNERHDGHSQTEILYGPILNVSTKYTIFHLYFLTLDN